MSDERPGSTLPIKNKGKVFISLVGLGLSILFVVLVAYRIDWQELSHALANATPMPWIVLAVASYLSAHVVRGIRTRLLVSRQARLSVWTATNVVVLGYAVNNVLPARLGELARAGMLCERTGLAYTQTLTVTLLERVLDGVVMVGLLAISALFVSTGGLIGESLLFGGLIFGLAAVSVLALVFAPGVFERGLSWAIRKIRPSWHDPALRALSSILAGVRALEDPPLALKALALSLLVWILEAGLFLFTLPIFGLEANYVNAVLVMALTNLGIMIPSSPGYVGSFHFFCMQGLILLGVAPSAALCFAILVHLGFYIPNTIWGAGIVLGYGIKLSSILTLSSRPDKP